MTWLKTRHVLISFLTVCIILSVSSGIIAYGRGYRLNFNKPTSLTPTGIITATSDPVAAQVLVNGALKTATNNSFNLTPDWYTITIRKEAYIPWEKKLRVQGEVVTRADAYLFPTSPSLSPITTTGILVPTVSPDGNTIAYFVPVEAIHDGVKKPGLYTLELADRSLGGRNRDPKLIAQIPISSPLPPKGSPPPSSAQSPVSPPSLLWSPDSRSIIVSASTGNILYNLDENPVTQTALSALTLNQTLTDWQNEKAVKDRQKLTALAPGFVDVATSSARLLAFSPDETKLLYEATAGATIPQVIDPPFIGTNPTEETRTIKPGNLYVYDSKEDKNYFIEEASKLRGIAASQKPSSSRSNELTNPRSTLPVMWFPTNKHLLLVGSGKIDVMEYDRTNWITLYSGPFQGDFVTPWPTGSRIVILTNLNPGASTLPNLYTVNLR